MTRDVTRAKFPKKLWSRIALAQFLRNFLKGMSELYWLAHRGMSAPTEEPAFDFGEAIKAKAEAEPAIGEWGEFLRRVPFTFANQLPCPDVEVHHYLKISGGLKNPEAAF